MQADVGGVCLLTENAAEDVASVLRKGEWLLGAAPGPFKLLLPFCEGQSVEEAWPVSPAGKALLSFQPPAFAGALLSVDLSHPLPHLPRCCSPSHAPSLGVTQNEFLSLNFDT